MTDPWKLPDNVRVQVKRGEGGVYTTRDSGGDKQVDALKRAFPDVNVGGRESDEEESSR